MTTKDKRTSQAFTMAAALLQADLDAGTVRKLCQSSQMATEESAEIEANVSRIIQQLISLADHFKQKGSVVA